VEEFTKRAERSVERLRFITSVGGIPAEIEMVYKGHIVCFRLLSRDSVRRIGSPSPFAWDVSAETAESSHSFSADAPLTLSQTAGSLIFGLTFVQTEDSASPISTGKPLTLDWRVESEGGAQGSL
jgi:hypothetical protein